MESYSIKTWQDTKRIARRLIDWLEQSNQLNHHSARQRARVVFLTGPLGSGKTYFVKELARLLGIRENISSPTFQLIKEYILPDNQRARQLGFNRLIHADIYRVKKLTELNDYLDEAENLILIEWGEKLADKISPWLKINFQTGKNNFKFRRFTRFKK